MSINSKQSVKCPKCSHLNEVTVWSSITSDDSPDLKKDLLSAKINMFKCDNCSHIALLPNPLLYHDQSRKLMISFTPCNDDGKKAELFKEIKETSKNSDELKNLIDYNLRFVTNYDTILEKILIFDNGLNDKVIEVLKVLILTQEPQKANDRIAVFGKCENDYIEFLIRDKKENQFYTSRVPFESYNTIKEQLAQSGVKYKSFDWEIVDLDYGASLLRGVNNIL